MNRVPPITIVPPAPTAGRQPLEQAETVVRDMCEVTPVVWKGRPCLMACERPGRGGSVEDYYLELTDLETGEVLSRFAEGYGLGCAIVRDGTFYAFASRFHDNNWNDVTLFKSTDLKNWEQRVVIEQEGEHLFNSSVCAGPDAGGPTLRNSPGRSPMTRPNIVFAFADDWGRYAGAYAALEGATSINALVSTPNFDRLAGEGVLFANAFVPAPSCTPCRSSLLSGQYFWRTGRGAILQGAVWDPAIPSYPLLLKEAIYRIDAKTLKVEMMAAAPAAKIPRKAVSMATEVANG